MGIWIKLTGLMVKWKGYIDHNSCISTPNEMLNNLWEGHASTLKDTNNSMAYEPESSMPYSQVLKQKKST